MVVAPDALGEDEETTGAAAAHEGTLEERLRAAGLGVEMRDIAKLLHEKFPGPQ